MCFANKLTAKGRKAKRNASLVEERVSGPDSAALNTLSGDPGIFGGGRQESGTIHGLRPTQLLGEQNRV